ncbi:MAG: selenium cofactor biosynthesis protein YqeC [Rectinemataceae bacterium]
MKYAELVLSLLPPLGGDAGSGRGAVLAFVGAGGKTSALYGLAEELADRGLRVLATTTTMIYDPRKEGGRRLDRLELAPELASFAARAGARDRARADRGARERALARVAGLASPGKIVLLASAPLPPEGKLGGVDADDLCALACAFDCTLVEADGAHRLPVKAPGPGEPVVPSCADLVVGCVGLDCLGMPAGPETVHRCEIFASLVGVRLGEPISAAHLVMLAAAGEGLFKGAPPDARRLVALNKAELLPGDRYEGLLDMFADDRPRAVADAVACCSFAAPSDRIMAFRKIPPHSLVPTIY